MAVAEVEAAQAVASETNEGRNKLAATVVLGHALKHLYNSGFQTILLPEIKIAFGLSGAQLGTLATVRQFSGWATTMGSGFLGDRFSSKTGLMLGISLGLMGISYFFIGISSGYLMLFAVLLLADRAIHVPPAGNRLL
jgi:sugar phosphate permease